MFLSTAKFGGAQKHWETLPPNATPRGYVPVHTRKTVFVTEIALCVQRSV